MIGRDAELSMQEEYLTGAIGFVLDEDMPDQPDEMWPVDGLYCDECRTPIGFVRQPDGDVWRLDVFTDMDGLAVCQACSEDFDSYVWGRRRV